ncbi:hypothetical protein [Brevibacillus fulvus]|uniref:Uncharacterized protein n=1 Tax=Brevibacillus fulvus TaxID=1125967 RepID=A0A938Y316_9BACL|nr:hypothetical protein [Brevibacillus fulvus]MBM7591051.1 hypothetical protein [Brevibacillus fulvus]
MFGFSKKEKKPDGTDLLLIAVDSQNRSLYQVAFPSIVANDIVSMLKKLQRSPLNKKDYIGEIGGFRIMTHIEAATHVEILDEADLQAHPVQIQDFANMLLMRLEALEQSGKLEDSEDLAFLMGELVMLRDGSFVPQK